MYNEYLSFKQFALDNGIKIEKIAKVSINPNMHNFDGNHYEVTLAINNKGTNRRYYKLYFSKGYGLKGKPPTISEVLESLQLDVQQLTYYDTFYDFCTGLGYDADSRRALDIYLNMQKTTVRLRQFLGYALLKELLEIEEDV